MIGDLRASELEKLGNSVGIRAPVLSGQHALDAWESEGGGPAGAIVRSRSAPTDKTDEEDRILRCLGAAVILRWNTIPTKLQKELFENASSMGELLQAEALKGQIARFVHKHKDDAGGVDAMRTP